MARDNSIRSKLAALAEFDNSLTGKSMVTPHQATNADQTHKAAVTQQRNDNIGNAAKNRQAAAGGSVGLQDASKATAQADAAKAVAPEAEKSVNDEIADNWATDMVSDGMSLDAFKKELTTMFWGDNNMKATMKGGGNYVSRAEISLPGLAKLKELLAQRVSTETDDVKLGLLMRKQDFLVNGGPAGGWPGYDKFVSKTNTNNDKTLAYTDIKDYVSGYTAAPWTDPTEEAGNQNKNLLANFRYFAKGLASTYRTSVYASTPDARQRAERDFSTLLKSAYQNLGNSDACHNLLTYLFYEDLDSTQGGVPTNMKTEVRKMLSGRDLQTLANAARASLYSTGGNT